MTDLTAFPLNIPPTTSAAEWLAQYDAVPRLLPHWPASRRMTLVGATVLPEPPGGLSRAYVITDPQQLDAALSASSLRWIFFSVPRAIVLAEEVRPEALTATAWVAELSGKKSK